MTDKGKVILVTGASRGVGKGIAESVGKPGDTIICVGRSVDSGTTVNQFGFEINLILGAKLVRGPKRILAKIKS